FRLSSLSLLLILLTACGGNEAETGAALAPETAAPGISNSARIGAAAVDAQRLLEAASEPGQWMTYGGTYNEQRFSQLDQITPATISELGLAWYADFGTNRGQEATPL